MRYPHHNGTEIDGFTDLRFPAEIGDCLSIGLPPPQEGLSSFLDRWLKPVLLAGMPTGLVAILLYAYQTSEALGVSPYPALLAWAAMLVPLAYTIRPRSYLTAVGRHGLARAELGRRGPRWTAASFSELSDFRVRFDRVFSQYQSYEGTRVQLVAKKAGKTVMKVQAVVREANPVAKGLDRTGIESLRPENNLHFILAAEAAWKRWSEA